MPYEITITTTDGDTYRRSFPSLDALDQFVEPLQWRENGRLLMVSEEPLVAIYSASIKSVTFSGFTVADIQKREAERQAHFQREALLHQAAAVSYANQGAISGQVNTLAQAAGPRGTLTNIVR